LDVLHLGIWQGVAMNSLKFFPGPPCLTILRPAGGPTLKRPYGCFRGGLPAGWPTAVFYPFGHPKRYAYGPIGPPCNQFIGDHPHLSNRTGDGRQEGTGIRGNNNTSKLPCLFVLNSTYSGPSAFVSDIENASPFSSQTRLE
jgi:hypothetical protein